MHNSNRHKPHPHSPLSPPHLRRSWCCSFTVPPRSPENPTLSHLLKPSQKLETPSKSPTPFPNSPHNTKLSLVGRILSPGRVSPIDSDAATIPPDPNPSPISNISQCSEKLPIPEGPSSSSNGVREEGSLGIFDVRLNLKGKNGDSVVLEMNSEVLSANSSVFGDLIANYRKGLSGSTANLCRIEVPEVENLNVFRETIELMFEEDITKRLLEIGVYRSIDILEVSAGIMFTKGVLSCLKYLEAVPWSEVEEEKLRSVFAKFKFDNATTRDIFARLYSFDSIDSQQTLSRQLVWSITTCVDANARNELKSLVKSLLCKSSVNEDSPTLKREDIYIVCQSCLDALGSLFEEASGTDPCGILAKLETGRSWIERISKQVDNINWLLEILLDRQMAEEFVDMWADQRKLLRMHESASPMVRYELSRVSAMLFIALGTRKLHCRSEARLGLLQAWFRPMLLDFGWLQRCRKGLDMKALEEAMGHALLTLPLRQQCMLFMEWFQCFSKHGSECPNLSKAFQIWWRRSFLRASESYAIESR